MNHADLLVQVSDGSSVLGVSAELLVLELLRILLGLDVAILGIGGELYSALGSGGQVECQNSVANMGRQLHERKGSARLENNSLKTILKHVGAD